MWQEQQQQQQQQQQQPNFLLAQATHTGFVQETASLFNVFVGQDTHTDLRSPHLSNFNICHTCPQKKKLAEVWTRKHHIPNNQAGCMPLSSLQQTISRIPRGLSELKGGFSCTNLCKFHVGFYFITYKPQTLSSTSSTEPTLRFLPANDQHLQRLAARFQVHDGMYGLPRWCGICLPTCMTYLHGLFCRYR